MVSQLINSKIENISGQEKKDIFFMNYLSDTFRYVQNYSGRKGLVRFGDHIFPVCESSYRKGGVYFGSVLTQYFDFVLEEIENGKKYSLKEKRLARKAIPISKKLAVFKRLEDSVFVNNYLLSTNLYPSLNINDVEEGIESLIEQYSDRAIVFRSVNEKLDDGLFGYLGSLGCKKVVCRQNYVLDLKDISYLKKRPVIQDQKKWDKCVEYYWENPANLNLDEAQKIIELYEQIYVDKYSIHNARYTPNAIFTLFESEILDFWLLRDSSNHSIVAVQAVCSNENQINTPFIGYDTSISQKVGLYRFMNVKLLELAKEKGLLFNMSSGAAEFKRQRGGEPTLEYNMVYDKHLDRKHQRSWNLMQFLSEKYFIPAFKKHKI